MTVILMVRNYYIQVQVQKQKLDFVNTELKSDHGRLNRESPVTVLSSEVNAEPKPEAGSCSVEAGDTNEVRTI